MRVIFLWQKSSRLRRMSTNGDYAGAAICCRCVPQLLTVIRAVNVSKMWYSGAFKRSLFIPSKYLKTNFGIKFQDWDRLPREASQSIVSHLSLHDFVSCVQLFPNWCADFPQCIRLSQDSHHDLSTLRRLGVRMRPIKRIYLDKLGRICRWHLSTDMRNCLTNYCF